MAEWALNGHAWGMTAPTKVAGLSAKRVALFESRFATELSNLVRKHGGEAVATPAVVEVPLVMGPALEAFASALKQGSVDVLVVLTGVGMRRLFGVLQPSVGEDSLRALFEKVLLSARGPKATRALRELGLKPQVVASEPYTWMDLLTALTEHTSVDGKLVAIQQYGVPHQPLTEQLTKRGARIMQLPVYRWERPADRTGLKRLVEAICAGELDMALFTSAPQVDALFETAREAGAADALRAAMRRLVVGSVGPSCSEGIRKAGLEPDFEPERGTMGHLVQAAARYRAAQ